MFEGVSKQTCWTLATQPWREHVKQFGKPVIGYLDQAETAASRSNVTVFYFKKKEETKRHIHHLSTAHWMMTPISHDVLSPRAFRFLPTFRGDAVMHSNKRSFACLGKSKE